MTKFNRDDRVMVEFEAAFADYDGDDEAFVIRDTLDRGHYTNTVPVSALTLIERKWKGGDAIRDREGTVFTRCDYVSHEDCWQWGSRHTGVSPSSKGHTPPPMKPITRLVPEEEE